MKLFVVKLIGLLLIFTGFVIIGSSYTMSMDSTDGMGVVMLLLSALYIIPGIFIFSLANRRK